MATVKSYGATGTVTGSCHLIKIGSISILVDCGMFQGENEDYNYDDFEFNPKNIDYLVLTHAHIDHIGRVPKLVKDGFNGTIILTIPTFEIAEIMLLDCAVIAEEEYKTLYRKAQRIGTEQSIQKPLYTKEDVQNVFSKKFIKLDYKEKYKISSILNLTLYDAGHILGSAFVSFDFRDENLKKRVVFSGDIGSKNRLILDSLDFLNKADTLFIESTYGDRVHKDLAVSIEEFKKAIINTINAEGNVIIPSFALERTQEILWLLRLMYEKKELPRCKVFLDSPLAIKATYIYENFPCHLNDKVGLYASLGDSPFMFPWVKYSQKKADSMKINDVKSKAIIIAGSGMCSGGRVMHHLKQRLWNPNNAIIFVGFQVSGTLGRDIVDGANFVKIYTDKIAVKSKVYTINGFSAHADKNDLLDWMSHFKKLSKVCLVHGELEKMKIFKKEIFTKLEIKAHIMKKAQSVFV
ncbi:MBL fold metallo-hydrolase RNA specificity domain-containing protein [Sulfurospirillum arcachonense]|uniref:MBL fold metallo-hydrolase RNA specificity domain-containing protein n=1 Tax=Sulfurospirillum arcachonense TaxID=57666 RepID=UPI000469A7FB|nr:MBL fold metallo-hydrolase [Sulfurospirillum arcachonense]